jgi:hypothetical protein
VPISASLHRCIHHRSIPAQSFAAFHFTPSSAAHLLAATPPRARSILTDPASTASFSRIQPWHLLTSPLHPSPPVIIVAST